VVCHGGCGSVLGALSLGIPSLPYRSSPTTNGATPVAWPNSAPASLSMAVADRSAECSKVLDEPGYRRAAGRVVGAVDALPPLDAAVDVLLAIARGVHRSGASGSPAESRMAA
jgi:hypothetical protein